MGNETNEINNTNKTNKSVNSKNKKLPKILLIIAAILLVIFAGVYIAFQQIYGYSMFIRDDDVKLNYEIVSSGNAIMKGFEGEWAEEIDLSEIKKISKEDAAGTYNMLLIGADARKEGSYGNSDSIILVTVNHDVKKIFLTSFMRDLYSEIPDFGIAKLNISHAIGGGPLLVQTLQDTYGVVIDNYARVDFNAMCKIINLLGGIDIEISDEEAEAANKPIAEMCKMQGKKFKNFKLEKGGKLHLNGIQAVGYSRVRKVGNSDYERTSRQRKVLTLLFEKIKELKFREMSELLHKMLPKIAHNVDQMTIVKLIADIPEIVKYEIVTDRIPYDGMYHSQNELLIPDMEATIEKLHGTIYTSLDTVE